MSLRPKIALIFFAVVGSYAALDYLIQRIVVSRSFESLERIEASRDLERVVGAIEKEVEYVDRVCRDRAARDDTRGLLATFGPGKSTSGQGVAALRAERDDLDLIYLCRADGTVVFGDIRASSEGELTLREFPGGSLSPTHRLMQHEEGLEATTGLLSTEHGPMLISSRPVITSERDDSIAGTLILGRFLDEELRSSVAERVDVRFELWPVDANLPSEELALLNTLAASAIPLVRVRGKDRLEVHTALADIRKAPAVLLRTSDERQISAHGETAARYALVSTIAAGLLILLVFLVLIQRTVLGPIGQLTTYAVELGKSEDYSAPLDLKRDDEIGILSREFQRMIEKLMQSRAQVVAAARTAGMSEIATGVLHNIGNVLNSVNVSATLVEDRVKSSELANLKRLTDVLGENADDLARFVSSDPKGKHFYPYLEKLTGHLQTENEKLVEEVRSLTEGIDHIRTLVNSQQSYAVRSEMLESVTPAELFESALEISNSSLGTRSGQLEVVREYEIAPRALLDRHKVIEILVNLIKNAQEAMHEVGEGATRLVLGLEATEAGLRFRVTDCGMGISAENLATIFSHGFTTKKTGHGFGLHSSANAAQEMGGMLRAESAGPGTGATFILDLPIKEANATSQ